MFSVYPMVMLDLKKVPMVKIIPQQIQPLDEKNPPAKFPPLGGGGNFPLPHNATWKALLFFTLFYAPIQALTNQLLSNVCLHTSILQYLFVNIFPYQNISICWRSKKYLTCFLSAYCFFWVSLIIFMVFLISV